MLLLYHKGNCLGQEKCNKQRLAIFVTITNGIQNLAALTRDHLVAPHVGLVETELRGDVYQYVCDEVIDNIKDSGKMYQEWLSSGLLDRSLTKKPVMTRSYGAKLYGIKDGVQEYIEDCGLSNHFDDVFISGNWMGEHIWNSMDRSLNGPMMFMNWVQTCASILAKANKPLIWVNPAGMECTQSPMVTKIKRIWVYMNQGNVRYALQTPTNKINRNKAESSSSPNIIHSCDASHLIKTVNLCMMNGINDFAMVHDSFGCHPDDAQTLLDCAKQAWVDIYTTDWMNVWYEQWVGQLGCNDLPRPEEMITIGTLDINDVKKSDFFFA